MKRILFIAIFGLIAGAAFYANAQKEVKQVNNKNSDQLYKVQTTNISIGNATYAQKALSAWKHYENNKLDQMPDVLADDVVLSFADGSMIKGKDNFIKISKDIRNGFTSVVCEVEACVTLKSPDDPEHEVVSIWGAETDTNKDGTISKTNVNEVWFFNKKGKAEVIHQLSAKNLTEKEFKQVKNKRPDQLYKVKQTNISIGNPDYAQKVLWIWKAYDDDKMDKVPDLLADDMVAKNFDGSVIKGKDKYTQFLKDVRNSFDAVSIEVLACVTLKTPDNPNLEAVSVWGTESSTKKDGTIFKGFANEVWFFNTQGKVVEIHQFASKYIPLQNTEQVKNQDGDQPYKLRATNLTIGNPAYAQKVLWAWRYFEDNTIDKMQEMLADDIFVTASDGSTSKGSEEFLKAIKNYRSNFTSLTSEVSACVTLKSTDNPDQEVVSIWGSDTYTNKDGSISKVNFNEVWYFNKQGKVVQIYQFFQPDNAQEQVQQVKNQNSDQPYKVLATQVSIGNPALAQKILWAWKYWDENKIEKMSELFSDDVAGADATGSVIKGKENFIKAMKDYRSSFSSLASEVVTCVTLKSPDNPLEAVSIWGTETSTNKNGKVSKVNLNEVWFFNQEGKVVFWRQFVAK